MGSVVVVKDGRNLVKLVEDLVVTGHVRRQNAAYHTLSNCFVDVGREGAEQIGRRVLQDVERHRAVVVLQRRNVVVAQSQLGPSIDLLSSAMFQEEEEGGGWRMEETEKKKREEIKSMAVSEQRWVGSTRNLVTLSSSSFLIHHQTASWRVIASGREIGVLFLSFWPSL